MLLALRDSTRASKSESVAVVLDRSRLTGLGRDGSRRESICSRRCCSAIGDGDDDASDCPLSGVSPEELAVESCETGVPLSGIVTFRFDFGVLLLGGDEVTISTSSANRTVESVRLRPAESGWKSYLESW